MTHLHPRLWIVRHAQVLLAPSTCYGRLDSPADTGATEAAAAALAPALPQVCRIYHSPLQRCVQLARAVQALRPQLSLGPEPRITEIHFGAWEGRPWSSIDHADIDAWADNLAHHAPGGGESLSAMLTRVHDAWCAAAALPDDVVWITHAGVARCVHWLHTHGTQRLPLAHEWPKAAPACGAWVVVPLAAVPP